MVLQHNCGIAAVYNPERPVIQVFRDIGPALQHRGDEAAGIAVYSNGDINVCADTGLVNELLPKIAGLPYMEDARAGIFHTRYSTTGVSGRKNAQPIKVGGVALGHNGNVVNMTELYEMFDGRHNFQTTTDSELIACLFDDSPTVLKGAEKCYQHCQGTYNLVLINDRGELAVFRDPSGNHPLFVSEGETFYAASEDSALRPLNLSNIREMEPGELIVVSQSGSYRKIIGSGSPVWRCSFEPVYFMDHDSHFKGMLVDGIRRRVGKRLAELFPADADIVVPVPDSGISYGLGFSDVSGITYQPALAKNRYVGRTYTSPEGKKEDVPDLLKRTRQELIRLKLRPIAEYVSGRKLVVTDDSIVRSNVSGVITRILKEAGALEVHWRIGYPPVRFPCFMGMDHATRRELAAAPYKDPIEAGDRVAEKIGADSVRYIPEGELREILGDSDLCFACITGNYPIRIPDEKRFREALAL